MSLQQGDAAPPFSLPASGGRILGLFWVGCTIVGAESSSWRRARRLQMVTPKELILAILATDFYRASPE